MQAVAGAPNGPPLNAGVPGRQSGLSPLWAERLKRQTARVRALTATLDAERLLWRPPDGGWGAAHVLEHLVVTADNYLPTMRHLASEGPVARNPENVWWKGTLGGRFLVHALRAPRKLPAPRVFQIAGQLRPQVAEAFVDRQDETVRLLELSRDRHWRKCRLASPASSLIRLNLGDCFAVLVTHTDRHLLQLERVLRHPGFPKAL